MLCNETLKRLGDLTIPGDPHVSTRWRWALRGVRGARLESIVVGGQRFSSDQAVQRFIARLNDHEHTPAEPTRAAEDADRELAAAGA